MSALENWLAELGGSPIALPLFLAKVTLLIVVAWILYAALRHRNPRWRVLVWRMTAVGVLVSFALAIFPPIISWPILPSDSVWNGIHVAVSRRQSDSENLQHARSEAERPGLVGRTSNSQELRQTTDAWHLNSTQLTEDVTGDSSIGASRPAAVHWETSDKDPEGELFLPSGSVDTAFAFSWVTRLWRFVRSLSSFWWVFGLWCFGVLISSGRTAVGFIRLAGIRRRARNAPRWVRQQADTIADELGCQCQFDVRRSSEVSIPCLVGLWRPAVLLPDRQCNPNCRDELPAILAHEFAHLKGTDLFWNLLLHGISRLMWFHPLIWRIASAHAEACDAVCDAIAANFVGDVTSYGRTLARLALRIKTPVASAGLAMARSSNVRRRIEALERMLFRSNLPRSWLVILNLAGISTFVLLGGVTLTEASSNLSDKASTPISQPERAALSGKTAEGSEDFASKGSSLSPDHPRNATLLVAESNEPQTKENRLTIQVVTAQSAEPIDGVTLRFSAWMNGRRVSPVFHTDRNGMVSAEWASESVLSRVWLHASKDGFVPVTYMWRGDHRDIEMPKQLNLRMQRGTMIGGVIRDESDNPVPGAEVRFSMPVTWPRLANDLLFAARTTTDAEGRWRWHGAPANLGSVVVRIKHSDYLDSRGGVTKSLDNLVVLKHGLSVIGHVLDANGRPVEGAKVRFVSNRFGMFIRGEPEALTGDDGRFVLKNCRPEKSLVTVQADGYSPQCQQLVVSAVLDELELQLEPAHVLRVRIVDPQGNPVSGAHLSVERWRGHYHPVEFRAKTDSDGRVEWRNAPGDEVLFDCVKFGHMALHRLSLRASDEETEVTLYPELAIEGRVTDASTGRPVPSFGVRRGYLFAGRNDVYWSRDEAIAFSDGKYRFKFDEPRRGHMLQVVAPGYLPATSRTFHSNEGRQTFDVQLHSGEGPSGIVLLPNGKPASQADVGVATRHKRAVLDNGYFDRWQNRAELVKTDSDGRFTCLPQGNQPYLLIVVHEAGFAELSRDELEKSNRITLKPWGRIEGKAQIGNQPDAHQRFRFRVRHPGRREAYLVDCAYSTKTDSFGGFRIERVIPGSGTLSRVVRTGLRERGRSYYHCRQTPLHVEEGETARVAIGGTGRPVAGFVALDRQPDAPIDWTTNEPATIVQLNNAKGRRAETHLRYAGNIDASGRFCIPDVPAGDYRLIVAVNNPPSPNAFGAGTVIGKATAEFTIPAIPGGRSDKPFKLPTITATMFDTLAPGDVAPEFVADRVFGGTVALSEFRGKLLVLDFWATWCSPCLARMPVLQDMHEQFGDNPRFALCSLSCDYRSEVVRSYVEKAGFQWIQAHVGGTRSQVAAQYGVRTLPATYLIGPDGRVLAKCLDSDELQRDVAAALKNDELFATTEKSTAQKNRANHTEVRISESAVNR